MMRRCHPEEHDQYPMKAFQVHEAMRVLPNDSPCMTEIGNWRQPRICRCAWHRQSSGAVWAGTAGGTSPDTPGEAGIDSIASRA
jgi:hypothetical protein